ncbi:MULTISPECIES: YqgE/AlgH family protein [unclassified Legionella]|uniref:YqgE/AlgH family protein n=1 Tax=unclassified Legionella TaxID=2622702 RepID=UPI001055C17D|nr:MULTISPECIES: YqgE/AlgH family protein [unclassified Legionella]MDI9817861.1 YqgE/AlgH family protein [Legionella sp. PL877]
MAINSSLANHLLIAMPSLVDPNFERSVIYICEHHVQGTVGLIINRPMQYPLSMIFEQMQIEPARHEQNQKPLLFGGPIQPERGFVIHRPVESGWRSSLALREEVAVTTSSDIIHAIAADKGPKDVLITLGYSGWGEHQLEQEVLDNSWLVCPFNAEILYEVPFAERWEYAGSIIGVKMNQLTSVVGHA